MDLVTILAQRRALIDAYNQRVIGNASALETNFVNRRRAIGDLERAFARATPAFNRGFTRSGLETSGIRTRVTDMRMGDQIRNLARTGENFDRQASSIQLDNQMAQEALQDGLADVESARAAHASSIAAQIRSNT